MGHGSSGDLCAQRREQRCRGRGVGCGWRVCAECSPFPPATHSKPSSPSIGTADVTAARPALVWGRPAGSPSTLTVNRPLVLLRLPMKNRAPCMDRVAGKGTSAVLKTMEEGFRATKEQLAEAIYQKKPGQRPLRV